MYYLNKNGFRWDTTTYCFNKVYFSGDGHVQYWLLNFRKTDNISEERQMRFRALLVGYCKTHTIHIKAKTPFSQCTSVDFMDLAFNNTIRIYARRDREGERGFAGFMV